MLKKFFFAVLAFILLCGILIFSYGYYLQKKSPDLEEVKITTCENTTKRKTGNITIIQSNICKTGYERGAEYGRLMKDEIQEVVQILNTKVLSKYKAKQFLIKIVLLQKAFELEQHIPKKYIQEMNEIAKGAEVEYSDILLINTYDDLLYLAGCSSLSGNIAENNQEFFHARNLDYPIDDLAGRTVLWNDSKTITIGFPGYIGALTATNPTTGISLSSHTSRSNTVQVGIPTGFLYRKIIEEAKTLHDVRNILEHEKRTMGNNVLVSSLKENKSSVFEFDADQVIERPSQKNFSIATNHFVSKKFKDNTSSNSKKRYNSLKNFSQNTSKITPQKIQKIFSKYDTSKNGWSSLSSTGTVQSIIIFPNLRKIFLANGTKTPVTENGYVEYDY